MTHTGADLFVDILDQYGVTHIFGNPGTTELPVLRALETTDIKYILALHEDIAVGMAAGYAATRRYHDDLPIGVANLHIAPGLAHGLGNLHGADFTGAPVVVTAGVHATGYQHEEPILSGDLVRMAEPFTKWSIEVKDVSALPSILRRAFRIALTPPTGPVFLALPLDVMMAETTATPERLGPIPTLGDGDANQINHAVDLLIEADEPTLIVGDGIARSGIDAVDAAVRFAEVSGARVHGEILMGEVNFPTNHDQWVSPISPAAEVARDLMDVDTLIFVGCSTHTPDLSYDGSLLREDTRCIHVGDAWEVGKNYPADAAIIGDPGAVLDQLANRLEERLPVAARQRRRDQVMAFKREHTPNEPTPPDEHGRASKGALVTALADVAPNAFLVNEAVTTARELRTRWPLMPETMISNKSGGLGYGLPATLGAAIALEQAGSDRPVVGVIGDGSYLYYPHALYTAARYNLDVTVVIPDNRSYNILKANMKRLFDGNDQDYEYVGMDLDPTVNISMNVKSHNATGRLVETAEDITPSIQKAIAEDGPTVLDVLVHDE